MAANQNQFHIQGRIMDTNDVRNYLRLFHSECLGVNTPSRLLARFSSLAELQKSKPDKLLSYGLEPSQVDRILDPGDNRNSNKQVEADLIWMTRPSHAIICYESEYYPPLLREISCPPPLLYVIGTPESLRMPHFAIVGSRNASASGKRNAYWMARELVQLGLSISSGMARGIDTQAHAGALDGQGQTVAVLGTGVDRIYPARNRKLAKEITAAGALISEFPLGTPAVASNFPRRNRIISGMGLGTLVVEAAQKSGSLITARQAMEQNREVFAIPGAITNPLVRGCHELISNGAKLVESPDDIREELSPQFDKRLWNSAPGKVNEVPLPSELSACEQKILDLLGHQHCALETLVNETDTDLQSLNALLLGLESKGVIGTEAGRYVRLQ
jgi:DNA processing protein|tara:strand:- start:67 stop:1230 length:1164 start_codon:yes stop_codon:yes gene_type:complete